MTLVLIYAILLGTPNLVTGLVAYDCNADTTNSTVISLRDVAPCSHGASEYEETPKSIQVLQYNEIRHQHTYACLLEVTRIIFWCGMHSHGSLTREGLASFIHTLGAAQCRDMHRYRSTKFFGATVGDIVMNGTTDLTLTIAGRIGATGACSGATYSENGRVWEGVVVQAAIKIVTRDYLARVRIDSNEISLISGVVCPFVRGYCMDSTFGESVWDYAPSDQCGQKYSILYTGPATNIRNRQTAETTIVVELDEKVFALTLTRRVTACGQELWQTEHPRLTVLDTTTGRPFTDTAPVIPEAVDLTSYVNSKFLYVEQAQKRALTRLYADTVYRRCELKREILKNRLLSAPRSPSAVGWLIKQRPGYIGRVLGEVLYLTQCIPRPVLIRRSVKCYNELPIIADNRSLFMAPITHIIQEKAEEVDCNPLVTPLYLLDNEWKGFSPGPTDPRTPEMLSPDEETPLKFSPIQRIGTGGLYTQQELDSSRRTMTFGLERQVVENILARKITGASTDSQGYSTLQAFDPEELKSLARSTLAYLWGWFTDLGMVMSGFMGVYFIIRAIKYVLGVGLNGYQIYRTMGCTFAIVSSLWTTLANWVLHQDHHRQAKENQKPSAPPAAVTQTAITIQPRAPAIEPVYSEVTHGALPTPTTNVAVPVHATGGNMYPYIMEPGPTGPHWTHTLSKLPHSEE